MGVPSLADARPYETRAGDLVAVTDQSGTGAIRLLDPAVVNWRSAAAQKWSWKPGSDFSADQRAAWKSPSDVKLRTAAGGGSVMLTVDSKGLAAAVTYPGGRKVWAADVGGANNPHSIELLPDGNIAVAASTGGFVRIYAASRGASATNFVQFNLKTAHGVHWDPARKVLWALGHDDLVQLRIGGTPANPTVSKIGSWTLPSADGHDLSPKLGQPDRLWVTTNSHVYEFSKSGNRAVSSVATAHVKSQTSMKNGQIVRTIPKSGCATTWCTDTVTFLNPGKSRTRSGGQFYKARAWNPDRA